MIPIPFKYPNQAILIPLASLDRTDRSRMNYGNLQEFFDDLVTAGYLIHPPTVSLKEDGTYVLIAGGRRTAAMELGGLDHIPAICFDELSLSKIVELEGEENFRRLDMDWREKVMLIARRHELKQAEAESVGDKWGMRETGELLGVSVASVSHAYQIRGYLQRADAEILGAPTMKAAYEILLKRRENEAMALTAGFGAATTTVVNSGFIGNLDMDSIFSDINTNETGPSARVPREANSSSVIALDDLDEDDPASDRPIILETKEFKLSSMFFHGDCLDILPQFNPESVDHVITDIPYGINLDNLDRIKNLDTVIDTHQVDQNVAMMLPFLENSYRILKPNGFCVFWYDLDHHEKLHAWAKQVGFSAQNWPLVWHKLHPCLNNAATKNYTKNVEFAMVLRKGNAVLNRPQSSCVVAGDGSAERKLYDNPFAKPAIVWRFIMEAVAFKGQVIVDPYCGQMSSIRAAIDLGLTPMGIEIDKDHFLKGLHAVKTKLTEITHGQAVFS